MITTQQRLAICVLTRNRLGLLRESIESALASRSDDYEVLVFDNASTDGTREYLDELASRGVLRCVHHPHDLGLGGNANFVLENVRASYCLMLHDDDKVHKDYVGSVVDSLESDPDICMVGTGFDRIDEHGDVVGSVVFGDGIRAAVFSDRDYFLRQCDGLWLPWQGTTLRMSKVGALRFHYDENPHSADSDFLCSLVVGNKVAYIPERLFALRVWREQYSAIQSFEVRIEGWDRNFDHYQETLAQAFGEELVRAHAKVAFDTLHSLISQATELRQLHRILRSKHYRFALMSSRHWWKLMRRYASLSLGRIRSVGRPSIVV